MEFKQFLKVIFRYRYMIILMCLSAVFTAIGLTYVISEKYCSSTKVLIRPQKSMDFVPKREEILNFPVSYYTPIETASKTYTEIVKSRVISERIVGVLGLDVPTKEEGAGLRYRLKTLIRNAKGLLVKCWTFAKYGRIEEEEPFNYAVRKVQKGLSVKPTKETYLFELEAEAKSPMLAAAIANTAADVLVQYLQEISALEKEKARQLSEKSVEPSRRQLEQARKSLVEFKKKEGVVSLKEETQLQLGQVFGLENTWKSIDAEIKGVLAQKEELARQLAKLDNFSKSAEKVTDNPIIRELKLQLAQKEVALVGMRKKYTPEYRDLQALSAEIAEIKEKLKQLPSTVDSEVTSTINPIYQYILREQTELDARLESLKAKSGALALEIEQKKRIIDQLPQKEARLANLELAILLEEQKYMFLSKELQEQEIVADRDAPDIKLIHAAAAPLYPSRPIKAYHAGLAALLSLIAGVGIALLKEHMNVAFRSVHEVERDLDLPVLMTIPKLAGARDNMWPLMKEGRMELPEVNRKYERAYVQSALEMKSSKDNTAAKGELIDISLGGACFYVDAERSLDPRERVNIEVDFDKTSGKKAVFEGVVVRSVSNPVWGHYSTIAVEFLNLNEVSADEIKNLINQRTRNSSPPLPADFEEPIRGLRADVQFFSRIPTPSFLITSCGLQEGKSTIAANLAFSLTAANKTAVLIDANLKRPSLHRIFGLSNERGLFDFLSEQTPLLLKKVSSGLSIITSGTTVKDPSALLGRGKMQELIESLKNNFDFVLVDAPALLSGPDSAILASMVDGVIVVLDAGRTTVEDGNRAKQILNMANAKILGTVMNNYYSDFDPYYTRCENYSKIQ